MQKSKWIVVIALVCGGLPSFTGLWAFGNLAEFMSADGNTLRTSSVLSTDVVVSPRWSSSASIQLILCTAGTAYTAAPINYSADRKAELIADITAAGNAWDDVPGGPTFAAAVEGGTSGTASCGPNSGGFYDDTSAPNGANRISFTDSLPNGVLAYTTIQMTLSSGVLTITEGDVEFNTDFLESSSGEGFSTGTCGSSSSGTCGTYATTLSFKGVLVHELGHFLGLSHSVVTDDATQSCANTQNIATMFPAIGCLPQSIAIESLYTDDVLSKKNLYSPSGFPNLTSEGSISGTVKRAASGQAGVRGAHVYALDTMTGNTIAGTFSGMSGTLASTEGSYVINGIPFDTDFIVIVEPVNRTEVHSNLQYSVYNTPITLAIQGGSTGLSSFAIEAYPDASVVDVRRYESINQSPGITNATSLRLTSSSPTRSDINFYISDVYSAPNDVQATTITFNSDTTITNSNPLTVTVAAPSLAAFSSPTLALSATNQSTGQSYNLTSGLPTVRSYCGDSMNLCVNGGRARVPNGTYTMTFTMTDATYGVFSGSSTLVVNGWNSTRCSGDVDGDFVVYADACAEGTASGGGGGCLLTERPQTFPWAGVGVLLALVALGLITALKLRRKTGNV